MTDTQNDPIPNTRLTSTTWLQKEVTIRPHPQGTGTGRQRTARAAKRRSGARGEAYRRRAQVVLWYRGGATCQVLVKCNGVTRRFDGDAEVFAVLQWAGWAQGLH